MFEACVCMLVHTKINYNQPTKLLTLNVRNKLPFQCEEIQQISDNNPMKHADTIVDLGRRA